MIIQPKTKIFISVSKTPGSLGSLVYNSLFQKYNIDAVYIPRVAPPATDLIEAIKTLGITGCSVSMPLKSQIVPFMDHLDDYAKNTHSVNTITFENGLLYGYNTDYFGIYEILTRLDFTQVILYGAGSVASTILKVLKDMKKFYVNVVSRNPDQKQNLLKNYPSTFHEFSTNPITSTLLINATPSSITLNPELVVLMDKANIFFDLVVSPQKTEALKIAEAKNLKCIPGVDMSIFQLSKQAEIYLNRPIQREDIQSIIQEFFLS